MSAGTHDSTAKVADLAHQLTTARSAVSIAAQALNHGETNLELHAAEVLQPVAESLDDILSELLTLRIDLSVEQETAG